MSMWMNTIVRLVRQKTAVIMELLETSFARNAGRRFIREIKIL